MSAVALACSRAAAAIEKVFSLFTRASCAKGCVRYARAQFLALFARFLAACGAS
jgi:hypothetical protein